MSYPGWGALGQAALDEPPQVVIRTYEAEAQAEAEAERDKNIVAFQDAINGQGLSQDSKLKQRLKAIQDKQRREAQARGTQIQRKPPALPPTKKEEPKKVWPWLLGGLFLIGGAAGLWYWYQQQQKGRK